MTDSAGEFDCEFCNGRAHARQGGSLDDNPYEPVDQGFDAPPYLLWRLGFLVGRDESRQER